MAYGLKYRFRFDSEQGTPFEIDILKDGYSGSVYDRAVGGSPVLRRDNSGAICGTSLEIPAECASDGEFEEFKTSIPFTFKVQLYGGSSYNTLIWTGFVTPELMDAPDIATPYDVQVSCTDGLGELKYKVFPARGGATLWSHLQYLLGLTNLSLSVTYVNDIENENSDWYRILHETGVNLDFLEGETCYDVLQGILTALHATITQYNGTWLIFSETGAIVSSHATSPTISNASVDGAYSSHTPSIAIQRYGAMSSHPTGWWPVGHMTHSNVPARKRMVVTSENHYPANILSDATWIAVSGGVDSGDYWTLASAGDGMKNSINFGKPISSKLLLNIKARNVGGGQDAGKLSVKVKAVGSSYAGSRTYYLTDGTYSRRNVKTDFSWSSSEVDSVIEVQAPATTDTDDDYVNIGIVLPIYRNDARDYFYVTSLEITISNKEGTYEQRVYGVSLSKYEQFSGFKKIVELNNGARGDSSDVALTFATQAGKNLIIGIEMLMYGVLFNDDDGEPIQQWTSSHFSTGMDYLSLMARDYALSIAGARTRERGTLNVPVGHARIPVAFRDDHDNTYYFVETFDWDLFNDELSVEMISLPATAITVSDEIDEQGASENGTGHNQADSASSGGGGGGGGTGTVTSVGLSMPSQFTVSGSPVSTSGTITVQIATDYAIPTSQQVNNWNAAYTDSHTHSNKTVLDGITAEKVAQWDSASGGGSADTIGIAAPKIWITDADSNSAVFNVDHVLLNQNVGAEAVLMTRSRWTKSKHGNSQYERNNNHFKKKGWTVAKGRKGNNTRKVAMESLKDIRTYILRNYTYIPGVSQQTIESMSYATWCTYDTARFGWAGRNAKLRKMFGVAIRIPNPAFEARKNPQITLKEHTQSIHVSGKPIPRYLYSAVTPLLVQISPASGSTVALGFEPR